MIRRAVAADAPAQVSVALWERLAIELISIIGEQGFDSLYARSVHLAGKTRPWLLPGGLRVAGAPRFGSLKACLEGRDVDEARGAGADLLISFIDILTVLIGELLTTSILRSAWGNDIVDTAGKEQA